MAIPATKPRYTVEEYLRREREALDKHEYRDGEILLIAGSTADHALITTNLTGELHQRLRGKSCRIYNSDLRIRIPHTVLYTYPDGSIICGPVAFDPEDARGETAINPRVIIEVLSPSTEAYDRGEKFSRYQLLDTLEEYVLVSQETPRIEVFTRQQSGGWLLMPYAGLDAVARLRSVDLEVPMSAIYEGIEFARRASPETP